MQWPWSWWTKAWTCGNRPPESPHAPPAHRMAPLMALCLMDVIRKGAYFPGTDSNLTSDLSIWLNWPFPFTQGSFKAPLWHHEVPDNLPCFLWMWVQATLILGTHFVPIDCFWWIWNFLSSLGLAYCRHLSTVRTHLSALVNTTIVDPDVPCGARGGLSVEVWGKFLKDSSVRFTDSQKNRIMTVLNCHFNFCVYTSILFRPMRKRRYTGLCILVVWLLHYAKRSGPSCWDTTSSPWLRNAD